MSSIHNNDDGENSEKYRESHVAELLLQGTKKLFILINKKLN